MQAWTGGREKSPAAICRKVAEVEACTEPFVPFVPQGRPQGKLREYDEDIIEVWGDGTAIRSYTYVDDIDSGKIKSVWIPVW